MTAAVIRFPPRRGRAVWLMPARDEVGWVVMAGENGWLHADPRSAIEDAVWIANNTGLRRLVITNRGRA